jgi:uncharacterized protein YifN (PemK superfamily)
MILICDFSGYVRPEMVKTRRVVVVSPKRPFRSPSDATVLVIPLSTVEPEPLEPWHHRIAGGRYRGVGMCWAKGDLIAHVSLRRLDRIVHAYERIIPVVSERDLDGIRGAAAAAIGIGLT